MSQYALGNLYYSFDSPHIAHTQYYLGLACKNGIMDACPLYKNLLAL